MTGAGSASRPWRRWGLLAAVASVLVVVLSMAMVPGVMSSMQGKKTVDDRMAEFGSVVKRRLAPDWSGSVLPGRRRR